MINAALRRGEEPTPAQLRWFAMGLASGEVSDAQAGAFAMGICRSPLSEAGRVALTLGMRDSGEVLAWDMDGPVLDKHSTGGLGDSVSLILAPALAACGVYVPMISGRGLGHLGGTLDKIEGLEGVSTQVSQDRLRQIVAEIGCAIVGATGQIAPADKRLYAVRDITSTVESMDLITASILSKKLAAGLEGLVLDVKCGAGAFMKTEAEAFALADALVSTANGAGCPTTALITDMDTPLSPVLGNALELGHCLDVLAGKTTSPRLEDVTYALGAKLLSKATGEAEASARARLKAAVTSGAAMECFGRMLHALGGPADIAERGSAALRRAPVTREVLADREGFLAGWNGEALGMAVVDMGGGRRIETDGIDHRVGMSDVAAVGTAIKAGDVVALVHAADAQAADAAAQKVRGALHFATTAPKPRPLVLGSIG